MMKALARLLAPLASLRLTVFCLAAAMVLVFAGTMAQKTLDTYIVQVRYFQSWVVWWETSSGSFRMPMFPGGHLIGAVLLANLLASLVVRFRLSWRKIGTQLIHLGLIIMLGGGLVTDLFSVSSYMTLMEGETRNYSEDDKRVELAVINLSGSGMDTVIAIPGEDLAKGGEITHESLPFRLVNRGYYQNCELSDAAGAVPASTMGTGTRVSVTAKAPATRRTDRRDIVSAVIEVMPAGGGKSLGTWLVSDGLAAAQKLELDGKTWTIQLRKMRYYKPYSLTLDDFSHKVYPGSQIPKDFSSHITLDDPTLGDRRAVRIYMNHPLRHQGDTYYQSSFMQQDAGTVLQVVRNPGYTAPYIACVIVSVGLIWQFMIHLVQFIVRRSHANAATTAP
ncbi:MAG: cytochrome c biogenesis protein ResB [Akkermansiaceae bacterium]|nr:cytochrome c biogenesis protein ResB [Akkermansiaceae bacterium]